MLTKQQLEEIQKRCEAATPGPWEQQPDVRTDIYTVRTANDTGGYCDAGQLIRNMHRGLNRNGQIHIAEFSKYWEQMYKDADFIAHARQDVPALLAHIKELGRELFDTRREWFEGSCL